MLVRRISEMKSKLPPSHLPENVKNELIKQDSLADKLQAMHVTEHSEECKAAPNDESEVHPQFLPIEMTGDSIEELARIDAELARDECTESKNDESSIFEYEEISMPPIKQGFEYTLVVDLDETLIHFNDDGYYLIRPGVPVFLQELSKYYEIVIFTAALRDYADMILDQIDIKRCITHRLYRQHCILENEYHVKDISKLGRGLEKILIIDNLVESFSRQPDNGILVKDWFDDMDDTELSMLIPFLKNLVINKIPDVREEIRKVLNYSANQ